MTDDTLPPGTTHADIDRYFGPPEDPPPEPEPSRPECDGCDAPLPWKAAREDAPLCEDCEADSDGD